MVCSCFLMCIMHGAKLMLVWRLAILWCSGLLLLSAAMVKRKRSWQVEASVAPAAQPILVNPRKRPRRDVAACKTQRVPGRRPSLVLLEKAVENQARVKIRFALITPRNWGEGSRLCGWAPVRMEPFHFVTGLFRTSGPP